MAKDKKFDYIQVQIASPEDILKWSRGEVKKAETINYRTYRPEPDGLMCEKIFGPTKDYECYCGKYKKIKYKGIICDRCGVEVTKKSVRRERLGHIRLNSPVAHIWFVNGIPPKLSMILGISKLKIQSVIYFSRYMVTECDEDAKHFAKEQVMSSMNQRFEEINTEIQNKIVEIENEYNSKIQDLIKNGNDFEAENLEHKKRQKVAKLKEEGLNIKKEVESDYKFLNELINRIKVGETISEEEYVLLQEENLNFFDVKMGAEAIKYLLQKLDLKKLKSSLEKEAKSTNLQVKLKALARLKYINGMITNNIRPEWMILDVLPVLPPDLRPIVQISGGRFASSDLNDLYRRVINRNNRLKRLIELGAPEVILRNEKRMLQEAVDALLDNEHRVASPVLNKRKIPLKSLSQILRGKQGRFRQNLLGKRVDYSGRSVIVGFGRDLKIDQVGIPKHMALELFKPFVLYKLMEKGIASNARSAKLMIEEKNKNPEIWSILQEITKEHPVMINRAPTLHKQNIQAFFPVLVDGDAIRIHPLITEGFNADFDGDQMAVHVPLTKEAIEEAKNNMMPKHNMLKAASGEFIMNPSRDLLQGMYYLTSFDPSLENIEVKKFFLNLSEAEQAYQNNKINLREPINLYLDNNWIKTTVGRIIFNNQLPKTLNKFFNETINKKKIKSVFLEVYSKCTTDEVIDTLNNLTNIGFIYSTLSGFSVGLSDLLVDIPNLNEKIQEAYSKNREIDNLYKMGLLSQRDKSELFRKIWVEETVKQIEQDIKNVLPQDNPLKETAESGARYSYDVINQVIGIKGPVIDANQRLIELPITSNYLNGFDPFEYFISAKGARKGFVDKGLRTADSGYLARRLVEAAHDVLVREEDCGTNEGIEIYREEERTASLKDRILGRTSLYDIKINGNVLVKSNEIIDEYAANEIMNNNTIKLVTVRSPLTCKTKYGVCQKCYGIDLGTNKLVSIGKAVGILAAQSLGEPTTQLTMRTFHFSGSATGSDITMGFPRVEELFEVRIPKGKAFITDIPGTVHIDEDKNYYIVKILNVIQDVLEYPYTDHDKLLIKPTTKTVKAGQVLFIREDGTEIVSSRNGKILIENNKILLETEITESVEYKVPKDQELLVSEGDYVEKGAQITKGNLDPRHLLETKGIREAQKYLIKEFQKVYEQQGINVNDKHIEIMVARMARYVKVIDPGDTVLLPNDIRDRSLIEEINELLEKQGLNKVKYTPILSGVEATALRTESFLSAASFQEQVKVLSDVAILGKRDYLRGLKENVIIGRLIPLGENARLDKELELIEPSKLILNSKTDE